MAAVGYLDGTLAIYDLSTQTLRHQCQHQVQAASSHGHGHSLGEAQIFESTYLPPTMLWLFSHTLTGCWLQVCSLNMGVSA